MIDMEKMADMMGYNLTPWQREAMKDLEKFGRLRIDLRPRRRMFW